MNDESGTIEVPEELGEEMQKRIDWQTGLINQTIVGDLTGVE